MQSLEEFTIRAHIIRNGQSFRKVDPCMTHRSGGQTVWRDLAGLRRRSGKPGTQKLIQGSPERCALAARQSLDLLHDFIVDMNLRLHAVILKHELLRSISPTPTMLADSRRIHIEYGQHGGCPSSQDKMPTAHRRDPRSASPASPSCRRAPSGGRTRIRSPQTWPS